MRLNQLHRCSEEIGQSANSPSQPGIILGHRKKLGTRIYGNTISNSKISSVYIAIVRVYSIINTSIPIVDEMVIADMQENKNKNSLKIKINTNSQIDDLRDPNVFGNCLYECQCWRRRF